MRIHDNSNPRHQKPPRQLEKRAHKPARNPKDKKNFAFEGEKSPKFRLLSLPYEGF